jgi:hypothetical protein
MTYRLFFFAHVQIDIVAIAVLALQITEWGRSFLQASGFNGTLYFLRARKPHVAVGSNLSRVVTSQLA